MLQQNVRDRERQFSRLFPTLFGGGTAKLVLTGEEILDSGVQVIAQPPGKRNTSIHLLSGGEKALTAISLVFALFQLNPAPFCLLDEVDAPLDDPNTDRFCTMVREMAVETQFLFISHNKITMEMANQLVGITMPRAGCLESGRRRYCRSPVAGRERRVIASRVIENLRAILAAYPWAR